MSFYVFTALTALASAVLSIIVGFIWYGPAFGKKWMEVIGAPKLSAEEMKGMHKKMIPSYLTNFAVAFVQFYAFGFFAAFIGGLSVSGALLYGLFVWLGFIMPIQAGGALWSGKSKKLSWTMFLLTAGYQLAIMLLGGVIWALFYANFI